MHNLPCSNMNDIATLMSFFVFYYSLVSMSTDNFSGPMVDALTNLHTMVLKEIDVALSCVVDQADR